MKQVKKSTADLVKKYVELWEEVNIKQKELKTMKEQLFKEIKPGDRIGRVKNSQRRQIIVTDKLVEEIKKAGLGESLIDEKVSIAKLREAIEFYPALQKHIKIETKNVLSIVQGI